MRSNPFATGEGRSICCYDGPWERIRTSRRGITTDPRELPRYPAGERLSPGEAVEVKVTLAPTAMIIHPGEILRLTISGRNLAERQFPDARPVALRNYGAPQTPHGRGQVKSASFTVGRRSLSGVRQITHRIS